jgi:hypothetical protein
MGEKALSQAERARVASARGILNINARPSVRMSEEHKEGGTLAVISHMGWEKFAAVGEGGFSRWWAAKAQLSVEQALEYFASKRIPTVLTVPCEVGEDRKGPFFLAKDSGRTGYVDYINSQVRGKQHTVYTLPTLDGEGRAMFDKADAHDPDPTSAIRFNESPEGKEMLRNLVDFGWDQVAFAGGATSGCLGQTIAYFYQQKSITILDSHVYTGLDLKIPDAIMPRLEELSSAAKTDSSRTEAEAKMLDVLRTVEPMDMRTRDYGLIQSDFAKLERNGSGNMPAVEIWDGVLRV